MLSRKEVLGYETMARIFKVRLLYFTSLLGRFPVYRIQFGLAWPNGWFWFRFNYF